MSYKHICKICNEEIPSDHCCYHNMHIGCAEKEIDVYFICLPHDPLTGFYEKDAEKVMEVIKDIEEAHQISRQKMMAGQYANLPEFDGF